MDKVDKILEKVTQVQIDLAVIKKDVSTNTKDLTHHVKRTDSLEVRIEQHASHHEAQLEVALQPIKWVKATFKILAGLAVILGILKTLGII